MVINDIWDSFLKIVRGEVGHQVVETWLKSVSLISYEEKDGILLFSVPNQFIFSWIKKNYYYLFKKNFPEILNRDGLEFSFRVDSQLSSNVKTTITETNEFLEEKTLPVSPFDSEITTNNSRKNLKKRLAIAPLEVGDKRKDNLSSRYNFKNFVVGPHNYLAYSAAQAISKGYVKRYNPFLFYGKTGLGKTHLLHCIGNEYKTLNPNGKVLYKCSISFVEEFISAVRNNKLNSFLEKYRKLDLLLIDDVQFFSQKEQTQEVFFNIFNRMYDDKKQIVLSCDTPPQQLVGFQERLISRLSWGLVADIIVPSLETRVAILMKKAEELKIDLSLDVATFIATNFGNNVREMEGALTRLAAMTMLTFGSISIELAKKELSFLPAVAITPKITDLKPNIILEAVLKSFGFAREDLFSKRRDNFVVIARQILIHLLKKHTNYSLRMIGSYIGGRKHSTVLHALGQIETKLNKDSFFQEKLKLITNTLH